MSRAWTDRRSAAASSTALPDRDGRSKSNVAPDDWSGATRCTVAPKSSVAAVGRFELDLRVAVVAHPARRLGSALPGEGVLVDLLHHFLHRRDHVLVLRVVRGCLELLVGVRLVGLELGLLFPLVAHV